MHYKLHAVFDKGCREKFEIAINAFVAIAVLNLGLYFDFITRGIKNTVYSV